MKLRVNHHHSSTTPNVSPSRGHKSTGGGCGGGGSGLYNSGFEDHDCNNNIMEDDNDGEDDDSKNAIGTPSVDREFVHTPHAVPDIGNEPDGFISQVIFPDSLCSIRSHAFLIGWNLDAFRCCVVCCIEVSARSLPNVQAALNESISVLRPRLRQCSRHEDAVPVILGEWIPNISASSGSFIPPDTYGIWITLTADKPPNNSSHSKKDQEKDRQLQPRLYSVFSMGSLYRTHCYLIQYAQPDTDKLEVMELFTLNRNSTSNNIIGATNDEDANTTDSETTTRSSSPLLNADIQALYDNGGTTNNGDNDDEDEDYAVSPDDLESIEQSAKDANSGEISRTQVESNDSSNNEPGTVSEARFSGNGGIKCSEWTYIMHQINIGHELGQHIVQFMDKQRHQPPAHDQRDHTHHAVPNISKNKDKTAPAALVNSVCMLTGKAFVACCWGWIVLIMWAINNIENSLIWQPFSSLLESWFGAVTIQTITRQRANTDTTSAHTDGTANPPPVATFTNANSPQSINAAASLAAATSNLTRRTSVGSGNGRNSNLSDDTDEHREADQDDDDSKYGSSRTLLHSDSHEDASGLGRTHSHITLLPISSSTSASSSYVKLRVRDISFFATGICLRIARLERILLLAAAFLSHSNSHPHSASAEHSIYTRRRQFITIVRYLLFTIIDMLAGAVAAYVVYTHASEIVVFVGMCMQTFEKQWVVETVKFIDREPFGIKFNHLVTKNVTKLVMFVLTQFRLLIVRHLNNASNNLTMIALVRLLSCVGCVFGGLTSCIELMIDVIRCLSLPITLIHRLTSFSHILQLNLMNSFWKLFQGKKINVLRHHRVDSCDYDRVRLLLGTIVFVIMLFVYPSFAVYFLLFAVLQLAVVCLQAVLWMVTILLQEFPYELLLGPMLYLWVHTHQRDHGGGAVSVLSSTCDIRLLVNHEDREPGESPKNSGRSDENDASYSDDINKSSSNEAIQGQSVTESGTLLPPPTATKKKKVSFSAPGAAPSSPVSGAGGDGDGTFSASLGTSLDAAAAAALSLTSSLLQQRRVQPVVSAGAGTHGGNSRHSSVSSTSSSSSSSSVTTHSNQRYPSGVLKYSTHTKHAPQSHTPTHVHPSNLLARAVSSHRGGLAGHNSLSHAVHPHSHNRVGGVIGGISGDHSSGGLVVGPGGLQAMAAAAKKGYKMRTLAASATAALQSWDASSNSNNSISISSSRLSSSSSDGMMTALSLLNTSANAGGSSPRSRPHSPSSPTSSSSSSSSSSIMTRIAIQQHHVSIWTLLGDVYLSALALSSDRSHHQGHHHPSHLGMDQSSSTRRKHKTSSRRSRRRRFIAYIGKGFMKRLMGSIVTGSPALDMVLIHFSAEMLEHQHQLQQHEHVAEPVTAAVDEPNGTQQQGRAFASGVFGADGTDGGSVVHRASRMWWALHSCVGIRRSEEHRDVGSNGGNHKPQSPSNLIHRQEQEGSSSMSLNLCIQVLVGVSLGLAVMCGVFSSVFGLLYICIHVCVVRPMFW
jgi:hypothetical protein